MGNRGVPPARRWTVGLAALTAILLGSVGCGEPESATGTAARSARSEDGPSPVEDPALSAFGPDGDGPLVVIVGADGSATVMDREIYEYSQGLRAGTDPRNAELAELLDRVDRVRVREGYMFRGQPTGSRVLLDTTDATALAALPAALGIDEDPDTFDHCACLGGPTLELYEAGTRVATLGIHHGKSIRWASWRHDALLSRPDALTSWLVENGIDREVLEVQYTTNHLFADE